MYICAAEVAGKKEKVMACGQDMEQSGLLDDKLAGTFVKVSWKPTAVPC